MDRLEDVKETLGSNEVYRIKEIMVLKDKIKRNKSKLEKMKFSYIKRSAPQMYGNGTSYVDADTIHGTMRDYPLDRLYEDMERIVAIIQTDEKALEKLISEDNEDDVYLKALQTNYDKVKYLANVKKYDNKMVADILGITPRHVTRLKKKIREDINKKINEVLKMSDKCL